MTSIELTASEAALLRDIADGELFKRIGKRTYRSEGAVTQAAWRLRAKVGALTNAHLIDIAYRTGLLAIPVDPARRDDEPEPTATEPESEYRFPLGAGLGRKSYPYRTSKETADVPAR